MNKIERKPIDTFKITTGQVVEIFPVNTYTCWAGNMDILAHGNLVKDIGPDPFFLINMFTVDGKKPTLQQVADLDVEDYRKILESIYAHGTDIKDLFNKN